MIGVDIVDLARISRSLQRRPGALAARLLTDAERDWVDAGEPVIRLAACLALKEAAIKALGGRPAGFAWTVIARAETAPADSTTASLWQATLGDLGAGDVECAAIGGAPAAWGIDGDTVVALCGLGENVATLAGARIATGDEVDGGELTDRERTYCGTSRPRRAGRQASRAAVLHLLGEAVLVETLAGVHPPAATEPCRGSHPPRVLVDGNERDVRVTISHCPSAAVAVAWLGP